ncbi:FAD:protein FMN transferase [Haloarcula sp. 1CSR25-25]|jgi:hypothetical protein|uniref:FAD:protein FMN transferase n=1 Tax=Haloarcula sp. 1CSR25-25 TaxID=2862545 RepID=UPI0028A2B6D0|nr:FAD:protein FMN transferase [Haloarcula sp. 1CSR25-25]
MNRHELLDIATIRLSSLFLGGTKFFAHSIDSPPLVEVSTETTPPIDDLGDPSTAGRHDVVVDTPLGEFEAAYLPWRWLGAEYPTLIYHHGSGEQPFDVGRFSNHVYDPTTESLGPRHESVTVVARRDCMEADALATTLAALPLAEARELAAEWEGLEALIIHDGVFHTTERFDTHVMDA